MVVAYQNQVVMEETLDAGLTRLGDGERNQPVPPVVVGAAGSPPAAAPALGETDQGFAVEARRRYDAALSAQKAGDWARYGEEIRQLGALLQRMRP